MRNTAIPLLLLALALTSCTCQQRLKRLHRQCPECFRTAAVTDTVARPALHIDTLAILQYTPQGTRQAAIETHSLQLNIQISGDTAYIDLRQPPDTVILHHTVTVPQPPCPDPPPAWPYRLAIILLILALIAALLRLRPHGTP